MGRAGTPEQQLFELDDVVRHGFGDVSDDPTERREVRQLAGFFEQLDGAIQQFVAEPSKSTPLQELIDANERILPRFIKENPDEAERLMDAFALWSLGDERDLLLAEVSRRNFAAANVFLGRDKEELERQIVEACEQVRQEVVATGLEALVLAPSYGQEPFGFTNDALNRQVHLSHAKVIAAQLYKLDPEQRLDRLFLTMKADYVHLDALKKAVRTSGNVWPEESKFASQLSSILMEAEIGRRGNEADHRVLLTHLACVAFPRSLNAYRDAVKSPERCLTFTSIWFQHYGLSLDSAPGTLGSID